MRRVLGRENAAFKPPARNRLVTEVPGVVADCFDAPVSELLEQRAESAHPSQGEVRARLPADGATVQSLRPADREHPTGPDLPRTTWWCPACQGPTV